MPRVSIYGENNKTFTIFTVMKSVGGISVSDALYFLSMVSG